MSKLFNALVREKKRGASKDWDEALNRKRVLERWIAELRQVRNRVGSLARASTLLDGLMEWEDGAHAFHVAFVRSFEVDGNGTLTDLKAFRDVTMGDDFVSLEKRRAYCTENGLAVDEARRAFLKQCACGGRRIRVLQRWDDCIEDGIERGLEIGEFCVSCFRYKTKHTEGSDET